MNLDAVEVFVCVVRCGSFSAAARKLSMPKSTVSAKVQELEKRLGVTLLKRSTRVVSPTQAGATYHATAERVLAELRSTERDLSSERDEPAGTLRLSGPTGAGLGIVGDVLAAFLERYPKVSIELSITERRADLLAENVDVALRFGKLPDDSKLVARRVGSTYSQLYASPAYLARSAPIEHPRDLSSHALIRHTGPAEIELEHDSGERFRITARGRFVSNQNTVLRHQALHGVGIASLPAAMVAAELRSGVLLPVLPAWRSAAAPFHLVYLKQRFAAATVRAFVEFMTKNLPRDALQGESATASSAATRASR